MRRAPTLAPTALAGVAVLALVAALWTWTAPGRGDAFAPSTDPADGVEVSLLNNGFHTDLAVPRAALVAHGGALGRAVAGLAPGDWVLIGWGDARFYVDQRPIGDRLPDGARAFFRPGNASVVMLDPAQSDPRAAFAPHARRTFRLSPAAFARMADRVEQELAVASDGRARLVTVRAGDDARFYAGRGRFWIGHLCNHWTAGVLGAAGLPVRPLRSVTSGEVMAAVARAAPELDSGPGRD